MIYPLVKYIYKGAKYVNSARKKAQKSYEERTLRKEHQEELDEIRNKSIAEYEGQGAKDLYDYIDLLAEEFGFDFNDETKKILVDHFLHQATENEKSLRKEVDDKYEKRLEEIEDQYEEENSWLSLLLFVSVVCVGIYGVKVLSEKVVDWVTTDLPKLLSELDFSFGLQIDKDGNLIETDGELFITDQTQEFRTGVESVFDVKGIGWGKKGTGKLRISTDYSVIDALHSKAHTGIDIPMPEGTVMYAPFDGVVTTNYHKSGGNQMFLEGEFNGKHVRIGMAHLKGYLVKSGTVVTKGTPICEVGNTGGHTTGSHVHFTYRVDGKLRDPKEFFFELGGGDVNARREKYRTQPTNVKNLAGFSTPSKVTSTGNIQKIITESENSQTRQIRSGQRAPKSGGKQVTEDGKPTYDTAWFEDWQKNHGVKYWNLGNIRYTTKTPYRGVAGSHTTKEKNGTTSTWFSFANPYDGIVAIADNIFKFHNGKTVWQMLCAYAPPSENDTRNYMNMISMFTTITENDIIDKYNLHFTALLIYAMIRKENSVKLPLDYIKECLILGFPDLYQKKMETFTFNLSSETPIYKDEIYTRIETV